MFRRSLLTYCRLAFATLVLLLGSQFAMSQENKSVVLDVDHVSVCGSNLDSLRQAFTDAGLTPDLGGPHGNGITQMAIIGFDDASYIELIAPVKPGATEGSEWARFMSSEAVTCAWAVGTNVLLQEVDRLKKVGIPVKAPERGSRKRPDGMSVEWMTADVGTGTPGSTLPFVIEDQTAAGLACTDFRQRKRRPSLWRGECRDRRQQPRCIDRTFPQSLRLGPAAHRKSKRYRQACILPRRTGNSGRTLRRRLALRTPGKIWRDTRSLSARHARFRRGGKEVQALRQQTLVRSESSLVRRRQTERRAPGRDRAIARVERAPRPLRL